MALFYPFLIIIHTLICLALIVVVLLQSSKGEGLAGAFGGGGLSGAVFGGRGAATFLSKATTVLAIAFMVSSISLTFLSLGVRQGPSETGVVKDLKEGPKDVGLPPASTTPGQAPAGDQQSGGDLFNQKPSTDTTHK